jgi:putative transposase
MRRRTESGLSIKKFCEVEGIYLNVYFYWQRKLRETACQELLVNTQSEPVEPDNSAVPNGWAICEVSSKSSDEEKTLTIEIGGCRVLATESTSPELLAKTCKVLVSLC